MLSVEARNVAGGQIFLGKLGQNLGNLFG